LLANWSWTFLRRADDAMKRPTTWCNGRNRQGYRVNFAAVATLRCAARFAVPSAAANLFCGCARPACPDRFLAALLFAAPFLPLIPPRLMRTWHDIAVYGNFTDMRALPRSLVLVVCVLLALPPGWCCMLPANAPAEPHKSSHADCCKCDHCTRPQIPKQPEPRKQPLSPGECPCTERTWTLPAWTVTFADYLVPAFSTALLGDDPSRMPALDQVEFFSFDSYHALHLRCCVWRC
jgi:hypothetical protein